jgi:tetratricopeptide (TPR) repeat protein
MNIKKAMMKSKNIFKVILLFVSCMSLTLILSSQEGRGRGRIHGTVYDELGNPIEGAKVFAKYLESKTTFESKSDKKGNWAMAGLGTGYFRITISKEGYETLYHDVNVSQFSDKNPPIDSRMKKVEVSLMNMPAIQNESSTVLFEEGNKLYELGKYAEAASKFDEFLAKNPTIYQVNINLGRSYQKMGEYEKAFAAYNNVLEKVKADKGSFQGDEAAAKALAGIGEIYAKQGNLEKANEYFKQAVDNFPEDETLALNVGKIFFAQGNADKAIEYFQLAIKIKEDWAPSYLQLGYAYLNKGEYKMAVDSLKRFLALAPDDPQAPTIRDLIPKMEELIKK